MGAKKAKKTARVALRLEDESMEKLMILQEETDAPISASIRRAVGEWLERHPRFGKGKK